MPERLILRRVRFNPQIQMSEGMRNRIVLLESHARVWFLASAPAS